MADDAHMVWAEKIACETMNVLWESFTPRTHACSDFSGHWQGESLTPMTLGSLQLHYE